MMTYSCGRCGKMFCCEESISYCPFCGAAYGASQSKDASPVTRIVIGSDSERTVQERYWQMARGAIAGTMMQLESWLPDSEDYPQAELDLDSWWEKQRKCSSTAQFKRQCEVLLRRIEKLLQTEKVDRECKPIDIQTISDEIERTGDCMAKAVGEMGSFERPVLAYTPIEVTEEEKGEKNKQLPCEWKPLFQTVMNVKSRFFTILDEYGLFIAESIPDASSHRKECANDLLKRSEILQALADRPHDPLFDEDCSDFVEVFWESVCELIKIANAQNALPTRDKNECAKIDALNAYAEQWGHALNMALDRAYQSQKEDMMEMYEKLYQIEMETEKRAEAQEHVERDLR